MQTLKTAYPRMQCAPSASFPLVHIRGYLKILAKTEGFDPDEAIQTVIEEEDTDEMLVDAQKQFKKTSAEGREEGLQKGLGKALQDGMLAYAQKQFRKTRAEGREEGLRQGREEGLRQAREEGLRQAREEGLQHGREETLRRNVRRMRASGMTVALVAEILDLPEEEVARLAEDLE